MTKEQIQAFIDDNTVLIPVDVGDWNIKHHEILATEGGIRYNPTVKYRRIQMKPRACKWCNELVVDQRIVWDYTNPESEKACNICPRKV